MKSLIKKISQYLPRPFRRFFYFVYEIFHRIECRWKARVEKIDLSLPDSRNNHNSKKRILVYHKSGLSFGGTEKFLQIIAKYLPKEKFDVFFMASWEESGKNRFDYLKDQGVKMINFTYSGADAGFPYYIHNQKPDIFSVLRENKIDIIVSAGAGYSDYPLNVIKKIPIILIGVFGYATVQKNVEKQIYISEEVGNKVKLIADKRKIALMPILSEDPLEKYKESGRALRRSLGILDSEIVFGRIGRGDDSIFDPIGIKAFKKISQEYADVSYLIMSPPPVLRKIVAEEKIKKVYFLEPSAAESDIWSFHNAIDVLAHFRRDGESQGLNIVESILCARPIISHRSEIWNAHLEYLDGSFSRVAGLNDVEGYYRCMKDMVELHLQGKLPDLGAEARKKAEKIFLFKNRLPEIIGWFDNL
jgi:hypothetical protein